MTIVGVAGAVLTVFVCQTVNSSAIGESNKIELIHSTQWDLTKRLVNASNPAMGAISSRRTIVWSCLTYLRHPTGPHTLIEMAHRSLSKAWGG